MIFASHNPPHIRGGYHELRPPHASEAHPECAADWQA